MKQAFNTETSRNPGGQLVHDFLLSLPQHLEEAIETCRKEGSHRNYIELALPSFSFALSSPDGKPNYHLYPDLKLIEEYCARPDVDIKLGLYKWPSEHLKIYPDKAHKAETAPVKGSLRQKYIQTRTEHYDEQLRAMFDGIPEKIETIKKQLRDDPKAQGYISMGLYLSSEFLPGYEAYQALHEYCKRPDINANIYSYRDTLYNSHFCVIRVDKPYAGSTHAEQMKNFTGQKLPQPTPAAAPAPAPVKNNLWRKIFGR